MNALDVAAADAIVRAVLALCAFSFVFGLVVGVSLGWMFSERVTDSAERSAIRILNRRSAKAAAAASACAAPASADAVPLGNTGTTNEAGT